MSRAGILLLGGTGFIGRALARRLADAGREVRVLARHLPAQKLAGVEYRGGSMDDAGTAAELLAECGTVVHLASGTTPGSSARSPVAELEANLGPMLRFLEHARERAPERLVFVSSGGTLYDGAGPAPPSEGMPPAARSYYGAGKIALEAFLHAFAADAGCRVTALRPSNVYGPGQDLRRGFGFVRAATEGALTGRPLEIWGDGSAVRDFLYIDDMVDACLRALGSDRPWAVYNVGSGVGHTLNEVVTLLEEVCGRRIELHYRPARGVDMPHVRLDVSLIAGELGWRPAVALEEGLRRTWRSLIAK